MDAKRKELLEKRAKATDDARAIQAKAKAESRSLTDDERNQIDKHLDDALDADKALRTHDSDLERERRQAELDAKLADDRKGTERGRESDPSIKDEDRALAALNVFVRDGRHALGEAERRDLQADSLGAGGALVLPMAISAVFNKFVDDQVFVRQRATVEQVTGAQSLGVAGLATDVSDPDWTGEVTSVNRDTAMATDRRELTPRPLAKEILVSQKLLRLSPRAAMLVLERLAYKHAIAQENAFLNGTGANQPLGVFVANAQGVSTSRDVSESNTTTAITAAGLIAAKYALKAGHWAGASWLFPRAAMKQIAGLVGSDGQFLWRQSFRDGEPDSVLGFPVDMSEYAPSTFTTGLYVGILANWKRGYMIADSLGVTVQRLDELYAKTSQVGFIGRSEVDGMPVLEEAFVRVKLG